MASCSLLGLRHINNSRGTSRWQTAASINIRLPPPGSVSRNRVLFAFSATFLASPGLGVSPAWAKIVSAARNRPQNRQRVFMGASPGRRGEVPLHASGAAQNEKPLAASRKATKPPAVEGEGETSYLQQL